MAEAGVLAAVFLVLLVAGVPVAIAIGAATLAALLLSIPAVPALVTLAQRVATGLDAFALLAIPFFILTGQVMNRGGMARRLIDFARQLLGGLPGGLGHVNVLASMLFGAIAGSAVAAASAVGSVVVPRMEEDGYEREFGAAVNIAAATQGLVIPPSNILIIYSLASGGVSIAALFLAGYLPGILVGVLLMGVVALTAGRHRRQTVRVAPPDAGGLLASFGRALPSLLLPGLVIGGITAGVFTATEAAAVAVVYALGLAACYRELRLADLPELLLETATTTSVVLLLVGTSFGLAWVLAYAQLPQEIAATLLGFADSPLAVLFVVNLTLLLVGTFMDMTPAVLIFTPIFLPVARELGIHPVHFGITMVLNLCIGLCTPPVGSVLFVGCSVAGTPIAGVVRSLLPLFAALLLALALVTALPELSLWLPRQFGY